MLAFSELKAVRKALAGLAVGASMAFAAAGCAADSAARPSTQRMDAGLQAQADAIVEAALKNGKYPGIAVIISRDGEPIYEKGFGVADLESAGPVTAQTIFPIGSVTKSFTALAAAQLVAAGKIDLDASIADYFEGLPDGWDAIKVRNLMNHTSGIFDYTNDPAIQADPGKEYDFAQMRKIWERVPLGFTPGTQWSYSNSGYYLLGKIVEKASGVSYDEYVEEHIFVPFGLKNTYYPQAKEGKPGAKGYEIVKGEQVSAPVWSPSIPYSAGALLSTVGDLANYAAAVHQSGKVSSKVRKIIYTQDVISGEQISYSLGGLNIQEIDGRLQYAHIGSIWGYTSYSSYYPKEKVAISILTNGDDAPVHPSNIERKLARLAFGEAQPVYADVELQAEGRAAIVGDYSIAPMTFVSTTIGFEERGGMMWMVFGGIGGEIFSFPLRYVGNGKFVAYHDDEITAQFDDMMNKAGKAEIIMLGGLLVAKR